MHSICGLNSSTDSSHRCSCLIYVNANSNWKSFCCGVNVYSATERGGGGTYIPRVGGGPCVRLSIQMCAFSLFAHGVSRAR